ncbi:nitrite reductase (NAD(P)H) small subunit, partial [Klebsiella aerogenes]|nr:nitrite reductase (NAD(P)H) small subunit [Klebsiella aerogenes]
MSQWIAVCQLDDITVGTGVCALVEQDQVAIFRPYQDERLYALSNI